MTERAQAIDQSKFEHRGRLRLVGTSAAKYDEDFVSADGYKIKIVFQGDKVVQNREDFFRKMAGVASSDVKPEEETWQEY